MAKSDTGNSRLCFTRCIHTVHTYIQTHTHTNTYTNTYNHLLDKLDFFCDKVDDAPSFGDFSGDVALHRQGARIGGLLGRDLRQTADVR